MEVGGAFLSGPVGVCPLPDSLNWAAQTVKAKLQKARGSEVCSGPVEARPLPDPADSAYPDV